MGIAELIKDQPAVSCAQKKRDHALEASLVDDLSEAIANVLNAHGVNGSFRYRLLKDDGIRSLNGEQLLLPVYVIASSRDIIGNRDYR